MIIYNVIRISIHEQAFRILHTQITQSKCNLSQICQVSDLISNKYPFTYAALFKFINYLQNLRYVLLILYKKISEMMKIQPIMTTRDGPKQTFVLRYTQADLQVYIYQKQYYGKYISYISNQQILKQTRGIFTIYEVLEYINAVKDKSKAFQIFYLKDRAMLKLNFISKIYGQMPLKFDILKVSNSKINDAKYEELKRIPNESTTNKTVEEINQKIDKIEKLIQQRGFKDFGRDHCIIKGCSSACVVDVNRAQRNSNAIISSEHCANNQRFIFQKVSQHEKVYRIKSEYPGQYLTVQYDKDGSLVVFRDKNEANDLQKFKFKDIGGKTCIISTLNDMHLSVRWGANESGKQIIATYNPQFQTHFWRLQRPREDFELL